ncbi:outer membrane receptor protein [Sulfuricella denitrificans skB26]|uniref:Outer membrane receptor protein n=1 Tax=Sulfuricella denitrificans (strain DSM 22764 / NBRC 105220 / skB26) TaxID=1163617 RepID=S6AJ78_SULDS|nr:TonB-dependent receptor [Sulfuricella denitrificans]BAN36351.1 outer membrane receptor protein [Sulfuricella denitrificans skB26]
MNDKALRGLVVGVCASMAGSGWCVDVDQKSDTQLQEMVIKGDKPAVPANLPATTEGVTAKQIAESINAVTSAEVIKYLPSIVVRERYIGDRNGIVSTRTTGTISSAQSIVYADNLLLSNFLGNSYSYPPRWGMVSPEEIERVDIIYGPFSVLYPGNSMGGVVQMTTRMPERFEAHANLQVFRESFNLYGTNENYDGAHASASIGNKIGDWSIWISGDHIDTHGHPMSFGTATAGGGGTMTVTGAYRDTDPTGAVRVITGGYSIDHTVQDNGKFKLAYDFSPTVRATYTLGVWQNNSDTSVDSYLKDALGNTVYNGNVKIDGTNYKTASLSPGHAESEHWMQGFSVKSNTRGEWDWEAAVSAYDYNKDISRTANYTANNGVDLGTGAIRQGGQVTLMDGTGWQTLDLRGEWRPDGDLKSKHQVSFGYHIDRYELNSNTYTVATDWLTGAAGALSSNSKGRTETQGLYLQDAWRFAPDWQLVVGGRQEYWKAFDGSNYNSANPNPYKQLNYADRTDTAFSPKVSLSFQASTNWALRGSLGKAVRFPTVSEMFQTFTGPGGIKTNDPNLKPEQVVSGELTAERALQNGLWRVSLFQEDKQDALVSQTDTTVSPNITSIQNVDKIRTYGIETALQLSDLWIRGFDLSGSVTYTNSKILQDTQHPAYVGMVQPRIPDWRATLAGIYHASDRLSYSLAARYSGRQYNLLDNSDINPSTYGGASSFLVADAKVVYKVAKQWSTSLGVDNIGNYKAYVAHPYPQRTVFANLKFDY